VLIATDVGRVTAKLSRLGRGAWLLTRESFSEWSTDSAPRLGAALSYYTVFALAPLLVLVVAVATFFLGSEAAQGQLAAHLDGTLGKDAADTVQTMVAESSKTEGGWLATVIGVATLLIGATGVMVELQGALNTVWKVKPKPGQGVKKLVRSRLLALGLVISMGFLLLVSLIASAALAWVAARVEDYLPEWSVLNYLMGEAITIGGVALLFALIFKLLPDAEISWRDVWIGALVTAVLFEIGKLLIGLYLGKASVTSTFGAAGSLAALLVWVYYSAQIVLLGAEFTRAYANHFGSHVVPTENAVPAEQEVHAPEHAASNAG
jgi:membrane protein